ncbi:MAG: sulfatase [Eudoraea sp.]|nr:sulfatase [Eudoraea sp.]
MTTDHLKKFSRAALASILAFVILGNQEMENTHFQVSGSPPNIVFLIADDWSYPHAGVYGDATVRTPVFDKLSEEGALFENAFCSAPSCSPSRASILTSRYPHQLKSAGNLWSVFPSEFPNWMVLLEEAGYLSGKSRKGWGPGNYEMGGYQNNPAGKDYPDFRTFLKDRKKDQPFAYWFGSQDPHRIYETNTGVKTGMDVQRVEVPGFLPDISCVRNDLMDYYYEVERFDRECGNIIQELKAHGVYDNTIIVMTSDNGMPFPRAKANLYDYGTRMPLSIYWNGHIEGGRKIPDFVNFIDFGPTFLEAAGLNAPEEFQGNSLLNLFNTKNRENPVRDKVFLERERHANVRQGDLSYPSRAIRTEDFLYIKNFETDRWPAGDPRVHQSVGQYGDVDNSISKFLIMAMEGKPTDKDYFGLSFGKRPAEELYVIATDPYNLVNEAANPKFTYILARMRKELNAWMKETNDLRLKDPKTKYWDEILYTPSYQFENFDLEGEISKYKMLLPKDGRYVEAPCLE